MPQGNRAGLATDLPYLNQAMQNYNINTPQRQGAFLGQVAEETGQLNHLTEMGTADGTTYQGRGALQLTGHANYAGASKALGVDFVNNPSLVADPKYAFETAGWYWNADNLNKAADAGNINGITKAINGCVDCAVTHNPQRVAYTNTATNVLSQSAPADTQTQTQTPTPTQTPTQTAPSAPTDNNTEEEFFTFAELFQN